MYLEKGSSKKVLFIQRTFTTISIVNIVVKNTSRYPRVIFRGDLELSGSSAAKLILEKEMIDLYMLRIHLINQYFM